MSICAPRADLATSRVRWPAAWLAPGIPNRHQVSRNAPAPGAGLASAGQADRDRFIGLCATRLRRGPVWQERGARSEVWPPRLFKFVRKAC